MKTLLHLSTFILSFLIYYSSFSQTYKADERRIYSWNNLASDWVQNFTEQYTYANGGNKETKTQRFSASGMRLTHQNLKTYNSNNDIISDVRQFWNSASMQWINTGQTLFTYDGSNNLIEELVQSYNTYTKLYENDYRTLYEYSDSDVIKITHQIAGVAGWVNEDKLDITYTSGLPTEIINSVWNTGTKMWDIDERDTATYSSGLRELIVEEYNGSTYDLFERYLTYYTISLEKEDEFIRQTWNGSSYVNSDRELSEYDSNENKTKYTWYSWFGGAWKPYFKEEKDFSVAAPLSTESFGNGSFKVFPNPASNVVNISSKIAIDKMELYNVLGKKVMQSTNTKVLNVESLNAGIYVLKIFNNNKSSTKKIVIK